MNTTTARPSRPYRMGKRADAAADTGRRIIEASIALYTERFHDEITLEDIASRAGVTVQTVLRRFHSKDELFDAAVEDAVAKVSEQRGQAPVGDVHGAIDNLLEHYEAWGRSALRLLAQEDRVPRLRAITDRGRELHAGFIRTAFAPYLVGRSDARRLEAELIALTDVYVWRLLHLDLHLDRDETAAALIHMVTAVLHEEGKP